ncbi:unnamed protein product [Macrosiphum euphorbiae]|uniref:BRICHOS domain-containing protein n=1 Tax=Macrosiphum euphorbiae TaxID=13131 RepID=A0AAV0XFC0_9HEMI|nr:unnamed protein product [Macrosiphum euphorbiae]
MTILTCSSFDGKSGKVSLISVEFRHGQTQPPPPYKPELLKTGDDGLPNSTNDNDDERMCMQLLDDLITETTLLRICGFMILLALFATFCTLQLAHNFQGMPVVLQDTEDNSEMVFTCYPSYAFAESDTLFLPDSAPPSSKNIDPVEGVIRKASLYTIKSARFLLVIDSSVNITGIVDFDSQRCYVMQLLHNSFEPRESLCNTLLELSPGHYSLDNINDILSHFHVVNPAITNLYDYGTYISKHCTYYLTFKMERYIATNSLYEVY